MSQRDGHEWVPVDDPKPFGCQGENNSCPRTVEWEKILFACDKSTYSGGYFCWECATEEGKL